MYQVLFRLFVRYSETIATFCSLFGNKKNPNKMRSIVKMPSRKRLDLKEKENFLISIFWLIWYNKLFDITNKTGLTGKFVITRVECICMFKDILPSQNIEKVLQTGFI